MTSAEATVGEHNIYNEYFNAAEQATETVAAIIGMFVPKKMFAIIVNIQNK